MLGKWIIEDGHLKVTVSSLMIQWQILKHLAK